MKEKYPELEKMRAVKDDSQKIGDFLEWVQMEKGYVICIREGDFFYPMDQSIESLLANYFDIDLRMVSVEKNQLLQAVRSAFRDNKENVKSED